MMEGKIPEITEIVLARDLGIEIGRWGEIEDEVGALGETKSASGTGTEGKGIARVPEIGTLRERDRGS